MKNLVNKQYQDVNFIEESKSQLLMKVALLKEFNKNEKDYLSDLNKIFIKILTYYKDSIYYSNKLITEENIFRDLHLDKEIQKKIESEAKNDEDENESDQDYLMDYRSEYNNNDIKNDGNKNNLDNKNDTNKFKKLKNSYEILQDKIQFLETEKKTWLKLKKFKKQQIKEGKTKNWVKGLNFFENEEKSYEYDNKKNEENERLPNSKFELLDKGNIDGGIKDDSNENKYNNGINEDKR